MGTDNIPSLSKVLIAIVITAVGSIIAYPIINNYFSPQNVRITNDKVLTDKNKDSNNQTSQHPGGYIFKQHKNKLSDEQTGFIPDNNDTIKHPLSTNKSSTRQTTNPLTSDNNNINNKEEKPTESESVLDIHDLELSDKNSSIGWPDGKEGCYFIEFSNGLYGTSELKYFVRLSNAKPILKCTQEFVKTIIKALNINQPLPKDIIIRCKPCNVYNWQAERRIFINPCNFQLKKQ